MSDLSRPLSECLLPYKLAIRLHSRKRSSIQDEFLKEAYRINDHILSLRKYLLSIRRAYLSIAPPARRPQRLQSLTPSSPIHLTDKDKDSVDANSKSFLRDLLASLSQLKNAEDVRRETSSRVLAKKYNKGFLANWAAGGGGTEKSPDQALEEEKLATLKAVRESVIWFLQKRLEEAGQVLNGMVEKRLQRDLEKGRSVLYKARGPGADVQDPARFMDQGVDGHVPEKSPASRPKGTGYAGGGGAEMEEEARGEIERQLSPEQLQLFAQENSDMLRRYEDTLDQVRTAERSMLEISELQTQLVQNLDIQSSNISQLVADSFSTTENVGGGNKQLKRATERSSKARMVFFASLGLCGFLVVWDLVF